MGFNVKLRCWRRRRRRLLVLEVDRVFRLMIVDVVDVCSEGVLCV